MLSYHQGDPNLIACISLNSHLNPKLNIERKSAAEALSDFKTKFEKKEWWRIFVDGVLYAKKPPKYYYPTLTEDVIAITFEPEDLGWIDYDAREKDAIIACLKAFTFGLENVGKPRVDINDDIRLIKGIHSYLATGVEGELEVKPGKFRKTLSMFDIGYDNALTPNGVKELICQIKDGTLKGAILFAALSFYDELSDEDYNAYQEILNEVYNEPMLKLNFETLNRISGLANYERFLTALSESISNHKFEYARYYPTGATYFDRIEKIDNNNLNLFFDALKQKVNNIKYNGKLHEVVLKILKKCFSQNSEFLNKADLIPLYKDLSSLFFTVENNTLTIGKSFYEKVIALASKFAPFITDKILIKYLPYIDTKNSQLMEEVRSRVAGHALIQFLRDLIIKNFFKSTIKKIWQDYRDAISRPNLTDDERLAIIGATIQLFERTHPFVDFNGRTYVNVLLNVLLLENGFPPAVFFQPNVFDGMDNIVDILKRGIMNTLEIYQAHDEGRSVDLFGVETDKIDAELDVQLQAQYKIMNEISQRQLGPIDVDFLEETSDNIAAIELMKMQNLINIAENEYKSFDDEPYHSRFFSPSNKKEDNRMILSYTP